MYLRQNTRELLKSCIFAVSRTALASSVVAISLRDECFFHMDHRATVRTRLPQEFLKSAARI